jgi:hypothetical protein
MTAPDPRSQAVIDLLGQMKSAWPAVPWEWDGRFNCALSTIAGPDEPRARAALAAALPGIWTSSNLKQAPAAVQQICGRAGGLRGGQVVFSAELPNETLAYCLWWPWGGGGTFSARVGAVTAGADLIPALRLAFGLA